MALSDDVKKLEEECEALGRLCGEMCATLTLSANVEAMHPNLVVLANQWQVRYLAIGRIKEEEIKPTHMPSHGTPTSGMG